MNTKIIAAVSVFLSTSKDVAKAQDALDRKEASQLVKLQDALQGVERMNSAQYDKAYGQAVKDKLAVRVAPDSVPVLASRFKLAVLALVNGHKPQEGESLKAFSVRCRDLLKASGVYAPKTGTKGGRPKGKGKGKTPATKRGAKVTKQAVHDACLIVASGDEARCQWLEQLRDSADFWKAVSALVAAKA